MLTERNYIDSANLLGCEIATIKAVAEVEGSGSGFFKDGTVKILFEPHVFWKRLKVYGLNPTDYVQGNEDILYPVWGTKNYPIDSKIRYEQLNRAKGINIIAAYESCSWGIFQIMGFNAKPAGYNDAISMSRLFAMGEEHHLSGFCKYIISQHLDDELRLKSWKQFARAYNGEQYFKHQYDIKLEKAYLKYKS